MRKLDWKLIVAIIALIITIFAGAFWRRADLVFDKRSVEIPLSDGLRKNIEDALAQSHSDSITIAKNGQQISSPPHLPSARLPDKLLYVDLRNVGHVPSPRILARIVVPGQIADKAISDPGSAFGKVETTAESDSTGELSFECQNFANDPGARIKVAIWYQQTSSNSPSVQIQDTSEGPAREVASADTARFYWWEWSGPKAALLGVLAALLGALSVFLIDRSMQRRWLERRLREGSPALRAMGESLKNKS